MGSQYQSQAGQLTGSMAARGLSNSGQAVRMQQDLAARKNMAEQEARQKAIGESNAYTLQAGGLYNQGEQQRNQALNYGAGIEAQRGELATKMPALNIQATDMFGKNALQNVDLWGKNQSEWRNALETMNLYNSKGSNTTEANYIQAVNQAAVQQASLDQQANAANASSHNSFVSNLLGGIFSLAGGLL